jgi:hypothetical protein
VRLIEELTPWPPDWVEYFKISLNRRFLPAMQRLPVARIQQIGVSMRPGILTGSQRGQRHGGKR